MVTGMTALEQLVYSTIRITCFDIDGNKSSGTGFFFDLGIPERGLFVPVMVTNKHVVQNAVRGSVYFTQTGQDGYPMTGTHHPIDIENFDKVWTNHPDPSVDLCVMIMADFNHYLNSIGISPYYVTLNKTILPTEELINQLNHIEDIIMIGYPNGIWDEFNNMPIIRKGITATHPRFNYNGKREFLIDAACFGGSSGSPVFLFNIGSYPNKYGQLIGANRVMLLGILYAGPQYTAVGDIVMTHIDELAHPVTVTRIPTNLGYIIKSDLLNDFKALFNIFE